LNGEIKKNKKKKPPESINQTCDSGYETISIANQKQIMKPNSQSTQYWIMNFNKIQLKKQ